MNRSANRWARQSSFITYFAFCGVFGLALIVSSAFLPVRGTGGALVEGLGVALLSTATVAAPITLYGHMLFITEFRDLATDKLLEMRLAPPLIETLKQGTFYVDMYHDIRFQVSLEPIPHERDVLNVQYRRDYKIMNDTYRSKILHIAHTHEVAMGADSDSESGFKQLTLTVVPLDKGQLPTTLELDASNYDNRRPKKFMGKSIIINRGDRYVQLQLDFELPPRAYLAASIVSQARVGIFGSEPFVANRPATSMKVTVVHRPETEVAVFWLHNLSGHEVPPTTVIAADQTGKLEKNWELEQGFFPGQGIQLRWGPKSNVAGIRSHERMAGEAPSVPRVSESG